MSSLNPRKRRRRTRAPKGSLRLGLLLAGLTAVNVYVFHFKKDTAVDNLIEASSITKPLVESKTEAMAAAGTTITEPAGAAGDEVLPSTGEGRVVEGEFGKLDTMSTVLAREGFDAVALTVSAALAKLVDPKTIWPGHGYALAFDETGQPLSFTYRPNRVTTYEVRRQDDGTWLADKLERPTETKVERASGKIVSSLYESVQAAGESPALVATLVDMFAWDINFYTDTQPDDAWKVLVEKQYLDGEFYRYGRVVAAEYNGRVGKFRAFYWKDGADDGYFDDKGQAIAKSFLKTPLRFVRISSKFDRRRMHPVLHREKAHLGVDYAAPTGTPIWAAASGKVVEAGMKRGSGNTVVIKHNNGYATRYYHLSKFAPGIRPGASVTQKQTIGYVGTTGLSTGPHLHFGLTQNGAFVDPLTLKGMREKPVSRPGAYRTAIASNARALDAMDDALAKK